MFKVYYSIIILVNILCSGHKIFDIKTHFNVTDLSIEL